jgi:hypothetical protein
VPVSGYRHKEKHWTSAMSISTWLRHGCKTAVIAQIMITPRDGNRYDVSNALAHN